MSAGSWRAASSLRRLNEPGTAQAGTGLAADSTERKLAQVARGSTVNLIGAIFSAVTTIAVTVLVTRLFAKGVAGAFFSATSFFLIAEQATGLGAYAGAVYFVARLRALGEERRIKTILRAAIVPVVVASSVVAVAMIIFATPLAHFLLGGHLGKAGARPSVVATTLRALAITLPFATLLDTFLGATRGYSDMRPSVIINSFGRSVVQTAGVAAAVALGSVALLAPLWALPYIPAAAAAWLWLKHIQHERSSLAAAAPMSAVQAKAAARRSSTNGRPGGYPPASPNGSPQVGSLPRGVRVTLTPRGFWRFTLPRSGANVAQIIIQRLDIVLVGVLKGPAAAAIYTAATRFLVAGQMGAVAIGQATQPQFTELFALGARRRANVLYQTTTAWLILLTWPMYLLILVNGVRFLSIFGHSYQAGITVLVILGLTMLLSASCGQVDVALITAGKSSWSMANGLLAMVVNVGLDLALIPPYGITGAAIGWSAAIVVANLMPLAQLAFSIRLFPFGRGTVIAWGLCLASFFAVPFVARVFLGNNAGGILTGIAAGSALMAAGLWYFRDPLSLSVMPIVSRFVRRT